MSKPSWVNSIESVFIKEQRKIEGIVAAAIFIFCVAVVWTNSEVSGAVYLTFAWCLILMLTDNLLLCLSPVLLASVFLTKCYNSYDTFIVYIWLSIPLALALAVHFIRFHRRPNIGATFWGLCAVSISLLLGGLGTVSSENYFAPVTLYYTLGLGLGMLVVYCLFEPYVRFRKEKPPLLFVSIYLMGLLALFCVLRMYIFKAPDADKASMLVYFQSKNNLATMLMIALPIPCYFASKNRFHIISFLAIYSGIILTGSRGGILMGSIEMVICLIVFAIVEKRLRLLCCICLVACIFYLAFMADPIKEFLAKPIAPGQLPEGETLWRKCLRLFFDPNEARFQMLTHLGEEFSINPWFGVGMGYDGRSDFYSPVKGAANWYHMWLPQIIGSLGIVGVVAFLANLVLRARAVIRHKSLYACTAGLSYLGLFLMSQVNPGEFCPLPYSMLAVLLFASIDVAKDSISSKKCDARS